MQLFGIDSDHFNMKTVQKHIHLISLKWVLYFSLFCYFLFYTADLFSQKSLLKFDNYTKDEGLLHSYILSILQDEEGYIWVGSYGGLNRFDGTNFKSYTLGHYPNLGSSIIYCILEPTNNKKNILWLGTEVGLIRFSKTTDSFQLIDQVHVAVLAIAEDDQGILWIGTREKGLIRFAPETNEITLESKAHSQEEQYLHDQINCILFEHPDILWIGTQNNGIVQYQISSGRFAHFKLKSGTQESISYNTITSVLNNGSVLFIGTWGGGINIFNKEKNEIITLKLITSKGQKFHSIITDIVADNRGNFWCATHGGGLYLLKKNTGYTDKTPTFSVMNYRSEPNSTNTLGSNILKKLYKDQTGNIWIGSSGGSLSKIDFYKQKFKHYLIVSEDDRPIEDNNISAVCEDKDGNIWYGTRNSGIYVYMPEKETYFPILPYKKNMNDPRNSIRAIYRDKYERIWVGTDLGFYLFKGVAQSEKYYPPEKNGVRQLPGNEVIGFSLDRDDALWLSIYEAGVCKLENENSTVLSADNINVKTYWNSNNAQGGILSNKVWTIYCDADNRLWIATSKGLEIFDYQHDKFEPVLIENFSCISEAGKADDRFMWFGTFGNGIYLMNTSNNQVLIFNSENNNLPNNNVNGILADDHGDIWISTGKGIVRITTEGLYTDDFERVSGEKDIRARVKPYSRNEGLQSHEFNLNACTKLSDGRLVFGGPKGFNIFNPFDLPENKYTFPVIITDFRLFNASITGNKNFKGYLPEYADEIILNYKQNYFTIDFNEICFTSPEKASYTYMLEGFDQDWIKTDARYNSATYTGLREGEYVFKVKAANADGYWGDKVTKLKIIITPPFWRRLIFRIPLYIFIAMLIIFMFILQSRYLTEKKRKELAYQKNVFENEKLKYDLEYKTRELASTTMHMAQRNQKLNEIKQKLIQSGGIARAEVNSKLKVIIKEIDRELKNQDNWESFEYNFNLIHNDFIKRLAQTYPSLSQTDIKICAYMRMNLSSKEIAELLNITPASLETSRIRIRKKMNIDSSVYLSNFILRF